MGLYAALVQPDNTFHLCLSCYRAVLRGKRGSTPPVSLASGVVLAFAPHLPPPTYLERRCISFNRMSSGTGPPGRHY